ncbi:hypothetical protein, partial [Klebsiella aerogenes]
MMTPALLPTLVTAMFFKQFHAGLLGYLCVMLNNTDISLTIFIFMKLKAFYPHNFTFGAPLGQYVRKTVVQHFY